LQYISYGEKIGIVELFYGHATPKRSSSFDNFRYHLLNPTNLSPLLARGLGGGRNAEIYPLELIRFAYKKQIILAKYSLRFHYNPNPFV